MQEDPLGQGGQALVMGGTISVALKLDAASPLPSHHCP